MKYNGVLKIKQITSINCVSQTYKTRDTRINNVNVKKVIKSCLKYNIPFKVGFNNNNLNYNMNYIEVVLDMAPLISEKRYKEKYGFLKIWGK